VTLSPNLRKFALAAHVIASVGWAGAVVSFLALAIAGLVSQDVLFVRASYVAMDLIYRTVVIPLGLAALVTGLISSLITDWGLVRYYWVIVKVLMTVPAVGVMLAHAEPVRHAALAASATMLSGSDLDGLKSQLLIYAGAALTVLLTATILSIYKPRGRTRYGARKLRSAAAVMMRSVL
jgi:hypothetical protein